MQVRPSDDPPLPRGTDRSENPARAVSRTATAPFDRLKVFLITSPASKSATPPRGRPGAGTLIEAVKTVYRQGGGIKAFWTGNGLNIIKIFPVGATFSRERTPNLNLDTRHTRRNRRSSSCRTSRRSESLRSTGTRCRTRP